MNNCDFSDEKMGHVLIKIIWYNETNILMLAVGCLFSLLSIVKFFSDQYIATFISMKLN